MNGKCMCVRTCECQDIKLFVNLRGCGMTRWPVKYDSGCVCDSASGRDWIWLNEEDPPSLCEWFHLTHRGPEPKSCREGSSLLHGWDTLSLHTGAPGSCSRLQGFNSSLWLHSGSAGSLDGRWQAVRPHSPQNGTNRFLVMNRLHPRCWFYPLEN